MSEPRVINGMEVPLGADLGALRDLVRGNGAARWAGFVALGHRPEPEALDILLEAAGSPDWSIRRAAVEAIALHHEARRASGVLTGLLDDESPFVVRTACDAAAALGLMEARNTVLRLLASPEAETRRAAVRTISTLWVHGDFGRIFDVHRNDPIVDVRREAAWVLKDHVDPSQWRPLFELWRRDPLHRHRRWACEVAAAVGDQSVRPALESMLADHDGHVRRAAERAYARLTALISRREE